MKSQYLGALDNYFYYFYLYRYPVPYYDIAYLAQFTLVQY